MANDRSIRIWNVRDLRPETERIVHEAPVLAADFGPDGKTVQAVCANGSIHRWKIEPTQRSYRLYMPSPWVEFSPDGDELIAVDNRHPSQVVVWDVKTGSEQVRLQQRSSCRQVRFSPDGRQILSYGSKGQANLWHRNNSGDWLPVPFPLSTNQTIQVSAFSPDGRFIATSEAEGGVVPGWVNLRRLDVRGSDLPVIQSPVEKSFRHRNWVYGLAFSPDGRRLASGTTFGEVFIRPVDGDGPELRLKHGPEKIPWLEFSPDSRLLASACADGYGRLWDAATGEQYGPSLGHREEVVSIRFSPDGGLVATGSKDGNVQLWDVAKGAAVLEPLSHAKAVTFVVFSSDGGRIATADEAGVAQVWDVMTGQATSSPLIHGGAVLHLAFSPDGKWLATGCRNGNVRMWQMDNQPGPGQAGGLIEAAERAGGFRVEESGRIIKVSDEP